MNDLIGEYEIIRYEPQFKNEVLGLLSLLLGSDVELNAAYLDWKYFRNPYMRDPIIYLALKKGRVVAVRPLWPCCWQAGQPAQRYLCLQGADAVVHPDHRLRGLLGRMISIGLEDLENNVYDFDITLSAGQYSSAGNRKMGWAHVGDLRTMQWDSNRRVRQFARRIPLLPGIYRRFFKYGAEQKTSEESFRLFLTLDRNYERKVHFSGSDVVLECRPRPAAMETLADRHKSDGRIRHVRDAEYYAWRYENPRAEYRFLFLEKTELEGYVILQQAVHGDANTINIVDWDATNIDAFMQLVETVTNLCGSSLINIWSVTLGSVLIKTLVDHGFYAAGESRPPESHASCSPLLVKSLHREHGWLMGGRDLLSISNWDLRPIYSDLY